MVMHTKEKRTTRLWKALSDLPNAPYNWREEGRGMEVGW